MFLSKPSTDKLYQNSKLLISKKCRQMEEMIFVHYISEFHSVIFCWIFIDLVLICFVDNIRWFNNLIWNQHSLYLLIFWVTVNLLPSGSGQFCWIMTSRLNENVSHFTYYWSCTFIATHHTSLTMPEWQVGWKTWKQIKI